MSSQGFAGGQTLCFQNLQSYWQGVRAVLCDPTPAAQDHLAGLLQAAGLRVDTASTLAEAEALLRSKRSPIVFTELMLPDAAGGSVVRRLRQRHAETVVVVCTLWGRPDVVAAAHKSGAADFLMKPVWPGRLVETLKLLQHRHGEKSRG